MAESPHGRFVWYEMLTVDKGPTIAFYKEVVGWGTQDWEAGEQPYTMFTIGEAPVGGIMDLPEEARAAGAPPHWLAYVSTGLPPIQWTGKCLSFVSVPHPRWSQKLPLRQRRRGVEGS